MLKSNANSIDNTFYMCKMTTLTNTTGKAMHGKEQYTCDNLSNLFNMGVELINNDPRSLEKLSYDLGIPKSWLWKYSTGKTTQPSVNRVVYLIQKMTGKEVGLV